MRRRASPGTSQSPRPHPAPDAPPCEPDAADQQQPPPRPRDRRLGGHDRDAALALRGALQELEPAGGLRDAHPAVPGPQPVPGAQPALRVQRQLHDRQVGQALRGLGVAESHLVRLSELPAQPRHAHPVPAERRARGRGQAQAAERAGEEQVQVGGAQEAVLRQEARRRQFQEGHASAFFAFFRLR